ncbi:MAG: ATP-binding protein [Gemmatimonadota bacterium]|nr:ATP-binding protein [Gemmatimonadota bacterium]
MQYRTPQSLARVTTAHPVHIPVRRVLWWLYLARLAVAGSVYAGAVYSWQYASRADTLLASLGFAAAMVLTGLSALYTHVYRREIANAVLYAQAVFDVALVTAIVHLTWDQTASQFASLYILVIAVSALLLPARGVTLISTLAIILYAGEAIIVRGDPLAVGVVLQLTVFAIVALGSGYIASRLRAQGAGSEAMAEELARFRLHEAEVERLHLRAERLEAVAELGASMAHEIKNPLASIRSAVEQLSMSPKASADDRTLTSLVVRESDRLARLLSSFLDFARVDVPFTRKLDLLGVVRNAAELASSHPTRTEGSSIQCDFPRSGMEVSGDEDMLHRAFFNLALNALQASPVGGVVRIEAATLLPQQLDSRAEAFESGAIAVRVIDCGSGIVESARARLFHPFFTTKPGGTGLGLAIVHRAVEAHRGVVVVDSDARGSRFTVLLPRT